MDRPQISILLLRVVNQSLGLFEPQVCKGDCEHCGAKKAAAKDMVYDELGQVYDGPGKRETPEEHKARVKAMDRPQVPADPVTEYKRATELIARHRLPIKQGEPTVGDLQGVPLGASEKPKPEPDFKHWRERPVNEESEVHKAIRERNEEVAATRFLVQNPSEVRIPFKTVSERAPQTAFEIECRLAGLEAEAKERADKELKDKLRKALS